MARLTAGIAAFGVLVASTNLVAETRFEAQVHIQIDEVSYQFRQNGFVKLGSTWIDELEEDDDKYITLQLYDNVEYVAVAVCDEDCSDIDLVLYDEYDRPIARDISTDDYPVISGVPDYDGEYYLEAQMADCHARTCAFGVAIYAR